MSDAPKPEKMAAFLATRPAAVPAPWRWELILIAANSALLKPVQSSSLRAIAWIPTVLSTYKALDALRQSVEHDRARELGFERVGDLRPALRRMPRTSLAPHMLADGARVPVFVPLDGIGFSATALVTGIVAALRRRHGARRTRGDWEDGVGFWLASALLRRWDWRAAGGPR